MLAKRIEASAAAMPDERLPKLFTCWEFLEFCTVRFGAESSSSVASAKSAADLRT
jgi:hypothetical protein